MILFYLMKALQSVIAAIGSFLPDASRLPTIGGVNFDSLFATGIGYIHFLIGIFPPLGTIFTAATIYLAFKGIMILLKLIFGHRAPHHVDA